MRDDLKRRLNAYTAREFGLADLERWIVSHLQASIASGDSEVREVMDDLDGLLLEYREGVASRDELEAAIWAYGDRLATVRKQYVSTGVQIDEHTDTVNATIRNHFEDHGPARDLRLRLAVS